jgi:quercetin dioxygenase-like cupin family protein
VGYDGEADNPAPLTQLNAEAAMPFFKLDEMPTSVISPGHSTAHGPTITGKELEIGYYTEPIGTGAKPHHHPSEQIILVLSGRLRMRIGNDIRDIGPAEAALIPGDQEHEQEALEDNTRFVSFKTAVGSQPAGET